MYINIFDDVMWGGRTHVGRPAPYDNVPCTGSAPFTMAVSIVDRGGGGVDHPPPNTFLLIYNADWHGVAGLVARHPFLYFFLFLFIIKTNLCFLNLPIFYRRSAFNGSTNFPEIWPGLPESSGRVSAKLLPP